MTLLEQHIAAHPWLEQPIYLTGQMRSGTSLLRQLLDDGDGILSYPTEPFFRVLFRRDYVSSRHMAVDWLIGTPNKLQQPGEMYASLVPKNLNYPVPESATELDIEGLELHGALAELEVWQGAVCLETYHHMLKSYLSDPDLGPRKIMMASALAFAIAREKKGGPAPSSYTRWMYKQPTTIRFNLRNYFRQDEVGEFLGQFPNGKIVYSLRDPRAILISRRDYFKWRSKPRESFDNLFGEPLTVAASFEDAIGMPSRLGEDRVLLARYEDIVSNPERATRLICEFLGIPFDLKLTRPSVLGHSTRVIATHGFDSAKVDATRAQRWSLDLPMWQAIFLDTLLTRAMHYLPACAGYKPRLPLLFTWLIRAGITRPLLYLLALRSAISRRRAREQVVPRMKAGRLSWPGTG